MLELNSTGKTEAVNLGERSKKMGQITVDQFQRAGHLGRVSAWVQGMQGSDGRCTLLGSLE